MKTTLKILAAIAVPVSTVLVGRWLVARQMRRHVANLFSLAETGPVQRYDPDQIANLPAPVQRYFRHVLKPGQPYLRSVRLRHDGQFKTDLKKDWIAIRGEEYFLAGKPDYIWIGHTTWFSACDQYVAGKGSLTVRLLGVLPIVRGIGPSIDQGELLRWLAERVWFPTSLLPGGRAVWSSIDDDSATLTLRDHDQTVICQMNFNRQSEIISYQAQRYSNETQLDTWTGHLSAYQEIHGLRIPTQASAAWVKQGEEMPYARFILREIEYDQPHAYF